MSKHNETTTLLFNASSKRRRSRINIAQLLDLASEELSAGFKVIIDAAFLEYQQRKPFKALAKELGVPYTILEVSAPVEVLRKLIVARKNDVSDAVLSVLEHQLKQWKPLQNNELNYAVTFGTDKKWDIEKLITAMYIHRA